MAEIVFKSYYLAHFYSNSSPKVPPDLRSQLTQDSSLFISTVRWFQDVERSHCDMIDSKWTRRPVVLESHESSRSQFGYLIIMFLVGFDGHVFFIFCKGWSWKKSLKNIYIFFFCRQRMRRRSLKMTGRDTNNMSHRRSRPVDTMMMPKICQWQKNSN